MLDVQIASSRNNPKVKTMGRKEIMRVVTVFTSLVILGSKLMPFTNAANTVRLISPTPYLFPELSISGHLFNFLPPFTTRAELSSKSKAPKADKTYNLKKPQEESKLVKIGTDLLHKTTNKKNIAYTNLKNDATSTIKEQNTDMRNETENPTKPFKNKKSVESNSNSTMESRPHNTKTHNRHFIGKHLGGVGGVFPPVEKESPKTILQTSIMEKHRNKHYKTSNSNYDIYAKDDSTCFHNDKIYKAGEMIKFSHKSNPCDKCRCEKHKGGGIINCFWQQCEGLPAYDCVPLFIPGACCPIYTCDGDNLEI